MDDELLPVSAFTEATDMDTPAERLTELAGYSALQLLIAANPATPTAVLTGLSEAKDMAIRRAIAQNPNASLQILGKLAGEFPEEFLQNPLLPILHMTQPAFVKELHFLSWASLLRFEHLPPSWFQQIKMHTRFIYPQSAIWNLVQLHVSQTGEARKPLQITAAGETSRSWREAIYDQLKKDQKLAPPLAALDPIDELAVFFLVGLLFPHMTPLLKEQWIQVAHSAPRQIDTFFSSSMTISHKALALLAFEKNSFVRSQVARHPCTSVNTLRHLAVSRQPVVRRAGASNPHTQPEQIRVFLADPQSAVRHAVVTHPGLTHEEHKLLAQDKESSVRAALAALPRLEHRLLIQLAEDSSDRVRAAVARNLQTPQEILGTLAGDARPRVRAAAAANPRLPANVSAALLHDPEELVRASFSGSSHLSDADAAILVQDRSVAVQAALAANPRTAHHLLERLWHEGSVEVWYGLARNPRLAPVLLTQLARYGNLRIRAAVAAHSQTPLEVLQELVWDNRREIWSGLIANPHTPLDVLEKVLAVPDFALWLRLFNHPAMKHSKHGGFLTLLAQKIQLLMTTNNLSHGLRRAIFQYYTALPAMLLTPFARSPYWEERYLVTQHPRIEEAVLNELAHDGICYVRTAAQDVLERRQRPA